MEMNSNLINSNDSSIFLLIIHTLFLLTVTISLFIAARRKSGPLVSWPIGLRWMLTVLFSLYVINSVNTVIEMIHGDPHEIVYNVIKMAVIPLEIAIAWRIYRGGLYLDRSERETNAV